MKLFRRRKPVCLDKSVCHEAEVAKKLAEERLRETRAKWPTILEATQQLASIRRQNHFAERIRISIMGEGEQ